MISPDILMVRWLVTLCLCYHYNSNIHLLTGYDCKILGYSLFYSWHFTAKVFQLLSPAISISIYAKEYHWICAGILNKIDELIFYNDLGEKMANRDLEKYTSTCCLGSFEKSQSEVDTFRKRWSQ